MRSHWTWAVVLAIAGCSSSGLPAGTCKPGQAVTQTCGACGTQRAACVDGNWGPWGPCAETCDGGAAPDLAGSSPSDLGSSDSGSDGGGSCLDGDVDTRACGNCGTMQRQCAGGNWQPFGACMGQGECAAGAADTASCGSSVGACKPGTQTRTCSSSCSWSGWSACGGTFVGPEPEMCGDGIDNNCNGVVDEGCSCAPADIGHGSSLPLSGSIIKMVSDTHACMIYALDAGTPSRLLVLDTKNKNLLTAITLPFAATDFDLSPNSKYLVVGHPSVNKLSVIDVGLWTVGNTLAVTADPQAIEVSDAGLVYYTTLDQWTQTHRVDLAVGAASDTTIGSYDSYEPDIELSSDGGFLYSGESGISGGNVSKYALASGMEVQADISIWDQNYGFPYPDRWTMLSPGGQHLYYAGYQLAANNLAMVNGATGQRVFTEDAAGTFAVGQTAVFDAQLVTKVATLPVTAAAAALTAADRELWYWSGGTVYYQNVDDYLAGVALGARARAGEPLSSYTIGRLVADPARHRVYGLDGVRQLVVSIDTTSGLATGAIVVGSQPADIDVSASGGTLWVGHEGTLALGKIDLASWQFSGFVPIPIDSYDVAAIGDTYVAAINLDQWTTPTLINVATGAIADSKYWGAYEGALAATADGKTLFVGDSGISGGNVVRYDVSSGALTQTAKSTYDNGYGFPGPARALQCAADGSFVYYAGYSIEGTGLVTLDYSISDTIVAVTPDKRLAISATKVYRASDGTLLGPLPVTGTAQAVSPDSKSLYVVSGGALSTIDLTKF